MPNIDIPTKRLIQLRPIDWVKSVIPDCKAEWITEMKPEQTPKKQSILDALFWIENEKGRFLLNLEPQGYYESSLPARMLRYRSDVWEYTMSKGMGVPSIKQVVIFFYPHHDNRKHRLEDRRKDNSQIVFSYDVVKIWKMKKSLVKDNRLVGLYPLLPLMDQESKETPEQVIEETITVIRTIENEELQADILTAMAILAGERYSNKLVKKYVRRDMLMNSPLFEEWVKEEREEAAAKAAAKAAVNKARKTIIELLIQRFDFVSKSIREEIEKIDDEETLDELFRKAVKTPSLEDFSELLKKAVG